MNYELEQRLRSDLRSDEKLLWTGQPAQGVRLRLSDGLLVPFSMLWGGFAIKWEWDVLHMGAPDSFALFGIPFVLIGLYIMFGRFIIDALQRAKTYYGLTSHRAIIISGLFSQELRSVSLRNLPELSLKGGMGGRGTIELGANRWPMSGLFRGTSWPGMSGLAPAFDSIDDAKRVYKLLCDAQHSLPAGA